jgi:hypothetical protein
MLSTFALGIFFCAIAVAFSREIGAFVKKLFSVWGVSLMLPLTLVTGLLVIYEPWIQAVLLYLGLSLSRSIELGSQMLPFSSGASEVIAILLVLLLTLLPLWALNAWSLRQTREPYRFSIVTGAMIWLFLVSLLSFS